MNLAERLLEYVHRVISGEIIACKKHIAACQRFMDDLHKTPDDDYPYYFDGDELYEFYEWAHMFRYADGVLVNERIELIDFQLFVVGNIFCWKRKEDDYRRFKKAYIQVARKNAKSQLLALIVSYQCFLSQEREECYIAGWGREQSSIVYNEIVRQIGTCDLLKGRYKDSYGKVTHLKSGSIIQPLSKEARKTGDGKNPSVAVIDEFHAHETSEIYDVLISGMVARKNRLIVIITTAGFNLSSPCYTEYQYVSKALDKNIPDIDNEEYFIVICELDKDDDIRDEKNWAKANPIVTTYEEGMEFLHSELKIALDVPDKMRNFLTKNMNIWVDQKENGYMPMNKWVECGKGPMPNLQGRECYGGSDLSKTIDLTSVGFEFPLDDGRIAVLSHSFMPEDTIAAKRQTDKVPYDLWVKQGWITATPGAIVDYKFIAAYIEEQAEKNKWTQMATLASAVDFLMGV